MATKILVILSAVLQLSQCQPPFMTGGDDGSLPILDDADIELTLQVGTKAELPCPVSNTDELTSVSWIYLGTNEMLSTDKMIVKNDTRLYVTVLTEDSTVSWNLVIDAVASADAGYYQCVLQVFPPQMKTVHLILQGPPAIDRSKLDARYQFTVGENVNIACSVTGLPFPKVRWLKMDKDYESKEGATHSKNNKLQIKGVKISDAGIYRCDAKNIFGNDMYEIQVDVNYKPVLDKSLQQEVQIKHDSMGTLECASQSNPAADIEWYFKGKKLATNWKYNVKMFADEIKVISELVISQTVSEDTGDYTCLASNNLGQESMIIRLLVVESEMSTESSTDPTVTPGDIRATTTIEQPTIAPPKTGSSADNSSSSFTTPQASIILLSLSILVINSL